MLTTILKAMCKVLMIRPGPDVVHAQTASVPLVIGFVLSHVSKAPLVVTCHGSEIKLWGRTTYLKYLQRMILGRCKSIVCTSDEIKRILNREYRSDPEEWKRSHSYSRRSVTETVFSMMKQRNGVCLSSWGHMQRPRELPTRVVLHNIERLNFLECAGR